MAPQVGFEPTTDRLTADCSTTELLRNNYFLNDPLGIVFTTELYGNNLYGGPKWTRTIDLTLIRRAL